MSQGTRGQPGHRRRAPVRRRPPRVLSEFKKKRIDDDDPLPIAVPMTSGEDNDLIAPIAPLEEDDFVLSPETKRECQCCYNEFGELGMTHCQNDSPHWFCLTCVERYTNGLLGQGKTGLKCLDQSDCSASFSEKELGRVLSPKAYQALDRLRTEIAIREANIQGLVHCPFCDFAAIMEDPTDRIFECQNCLEKSCRYCHVKSHHPMTCEKYQQQKYGDARHTVEEAMTAALVRNCNGCKKPFVKEGGCNRMYCSSCSNSQCFVCSVSVTDYSHFSDSGPCRLYGDDEARVNAAVMRAQGEAITEAMRSRDDVSSDGLTVDKTLLPREFNKRNLVVDIRRPSLSFPTSMSSPDQEINENSGYSPAVFFAEGPGVVVAPGPFQFLPNFHNPDPPQYYLQQQGAPTYSAYQNNPLPLESPIVPTGQYPNDTFFRTYPIAQYPYTDFTYPPFVGAPINHGLPMQPPLQPSRPRPQYPAAMNATGPTDEAVLTDGAPWHNKDDPDGDQSRGKQSYRHSVDTMLTRKRKSGKAPVNHHKRQVKPDHLPRTGCGGSLLCEACRRGKRGKKHSDFVFQPIDQIIRSMPAPYAWKPVIPAVVDTTPRTPKKKQRG